MQGHSAPEDSAAGSQMPVGGRVNYLGHAAVASWFSTEPMFVLGSMVPDFSGFLRLALPLPRDATFSAGLTMHHATDCVFHATTAFRNLNRAAAQALAEANLPRGPARAAAHVGVEMLIDVAMAECPDTLASFHAALRTLDPERLLQALPIDENDHVRLLHVAAVVRQHGADLWAANPQTIAARIARTLAARQRLRIETETLPNVARWVESTLGEVRATIPTLEAELRQGLEDEWLERSAERDSG